MSQEAKLQEKASIYVSKREEEEDILTFTLTGINVSIANGLRRTMLSDLPTLVFKTFPDSENKAKITTNTSRFNNEILKQRLACIPIHGITHDQPYDELEVVIDKRNDTHDIQLVTTEDFKIRNTKSGKFLVDKVVRKIFPPDKITSDYIILARLRPRISNEVPGEAIQITAHMSLHTAGEDGAFNVTSCCTYKCSPDKIKQDQEWQEHVKSIPVDETLEMKKSDWYNHEAGRIFIKDSFDFKLQTIGVFANTDIVKNACLVLSQKIAAFAEQLLPDSISSIILTQSRSTIANSYDLKLEGIGYTVGKILEHLIHEKYYKGEGTLSFVGFRKDHPHDTHSTLRIAFKSEDDSVDTNLTIIEIIQSVCKDAIQIYSAIAEEFS